METQRTTLWCFDWIKQRYFDVIKNLNAKVLKIIFFNTLIIFLNSLLAETAEKHGEEQVQIWRRSFDIPPPPMEPGHPYFESIVKDPRYAEEPKIEEFPMFESLKLTIERTLPYWNDVIVPQVFSKYS